MQNKIYDILKQIPVALGAAESEALTCFISGIINAQLILEGVTLFEDKKSLDILAFIHLNYQNLGSCIESIPFDIRDQLSKELEPVFGTNASGHMKSWVTRSACAHLKGFSELNLCHTPEVERGIIAEATLALETLRKAVANFNKTGCVLDSGFIKTIIAGIGRSLQPLLKSTPIPLMEACLNPATKVASFQNCVDTLNACFQILPNSLVEFRISLPAQALAILTLQFIGENIRQMHALDSESVKPLRWLRDKRNKTAHQYHMFEQGSDNPDTLQRTILDLHQNYLLIFMQGAKPAKTVPQIRNVKEGQQTKISFAAEPVLSEVEKASATKTTKHKKKLKKKIEEDDDDVFKEFAFSIEPKEEPLSQITIKSFKTKIITFLSKTSMPKNLVIRIKARPPERWNRMFICELVIFFITSKDLIPNDIHAYKKVEICQFILQHLTLFTDETPEEFLNSNILLYPIPKGLTTAHPNSGAKTYSIDPKDPLFSITHFNPNLISPNAKIYVRFLEYAVKYESIEIAKLLLEQGANPNLICRHDIGSDTAFTYCIRNNLKELALTLLQAGARTLNLYMSGKPVTEYIYLYSPHSIELLEEIILQTSSIQTLKILFQYFWYNLLVVQKSGPVFSLDIQVSQEFEEEAYDHLQPGKPIIFLQKMIMHVCNKFGSKHAKDFFVSTITAPDGNKINFINLSYELGLNKVSKVFANIFQVLISLKDYPLHYSALLSGEITDFLTCELLCEEESTSKDRDCYLWDKSLRNTYLAVSSFLPFDAPRFDNSIINLSKLVLAYIQSPVISDLLINISAIDHIAPSTFNVLRLCNASMTTVINDRQQRQSIEVDIPRQRKVSFCEQLSSSCLAIM